MSPLALALIVFVTAATLVFAVGMFFLELRRGRAAADAAEAARRSRLVRVKRPQEDLSAAGPVASFDNWFTLLLRDAGLNWNPTLAALLLLLWAAVCGFAMYIWDERFGPAVVVALIALPLPVAWLAWRRSRRTSQLQEQLPGALETLARSLQSGRSLEQAVRMVGEHAPQPLGAEFRWCAHQLEMGLSVPAVMRSLTQRLPLYDTRILATTLSVHRQSGGNVVRVLERLAQVIRDRLAYRRQLRATMAAGRMSAAVVALVAPAVFTYFFFFQPEYFRSMFQSTLGIMLLVIALILEVVGLIWTARLTKPAY